MPTRPLHMASTEAVGAEYSGQWVAWNADHSRIVAQAKTFDDLWKSIQDSGVDDPVVEKIPRWDSRFVGK